MCGAFFIGGIDLLSLLFEGIPLICLIMAATEAILMIASSEEEANLYYATHFRVPDPVVFFQIGRKKTLILSDLELDRGLEEADVDEILSMREVGEMGTLSAREKKFPPYARMVHLVFKKRGVKRIVVPQSFPAYYYEALIGLGYKISIRPDPFWPQRLIKSTEEKNFIKKTADKVGVALNEALLVLEKSKIKKNKIYYGKETVTSEMLKTIVNTKLMELGCIATDTIIASGRQASLPHHGGSGPIVPHTPIIFDIFPQNAHNKYHADMTRTFVKGKPSADIKRMYKAVYEANKRARQKVKAGVSAKTIHLEAEKTLKAFGFKTGSFNGRMQGFIHSTGHGLGLDVHEAPSVSSRGGRIKAKQVITIEPGLYYEDLGGIRIEDDIYVLKDGCEVLTKFPKYFEIDR